jgi:hypothetical protein
LDFFPALVFVKLTVDSLSALESNSPHFIGVRDEVAQAPVLFAVLPKHNELEINLEAITQTLHVPEQDNTPCADVHS